MENDSRGRGAENIYGGSSVESRKKYGLKRRGKIKYNVVRRGRSTLIAALLQSGRGVFGCRWRRGLWIWGLLMDYNIAPLRISVPRSSGAPRAGGPCPCSQLRQPSLRIPAHHLLYPQGREILDAPPSIAFGGCSSAMRQWLIRLDCGAVRCRCCRCCSTASKHLHESGLSASRLVLTARVCSSGFRFPPSQSPKLTVTDKHSLTRFGNRSRLCLAGGFFGCRYPGIRQGNCASLGPLPSGQSGEAEVWPRSPGEQAATTSSLCLPTSTRPRSHRSHRSHRNPHTLAQRRQPRTADSEMDCVAPCSQIMGGFSGLPKHVPLAPELWDRAVQSPNWEVGADPPV